MTTLSITLRDEDGHFIENAVQSGSYLTPSEVVATALELLKTHEQLRQIRREHLKREVLKGIDEQTGVKRSSSPRRTFKDWAVSDSPVASHSSFANSSAGLLVGNGNAVLQNSPRLPVCGLPGVLEARPTTPKEVVASKASARRLVDSLTA